MRAIRVVLMLTLGCAASMHAQKQLGVQLSKADGTLKLIQTRQVSLTETNDFPVKDGFVFTVTCLEADLCKDVKVIDKAKNQDLLTRPAADGMSAQGRFPGSTQPNPADVPMTLVVRVGDEAAVPEVKLLGMGTTTETAKVTDTTKKDGGDDESLVALLSARCPDVELGSDTVFTVTPLGNVLRRPTQLLNEGSVVVVEVYGPQTLLSQMKVARKSPFRPYRLNNIVSAGQTVPVKEFEEQGLAEEECATRRFILGDFAPGRGEVEISAFTNDGLVSTGTFDFTVNDLYTGAFAIGAIRTEIGDPSFSSVFNGTDTVVSVSDSDDRLLYAITYTPFIWGARDVRVSPREWWHRVNPMVGIVLNSIPNNGLAGVSIDLSNRLYLQTGVHAARVSKLDPTSGLTVGDEFENRGARVPVVREWEFDWFYGITVDLEAGLGLIRSVVGAKPGT